MKAGKRLRLSLRTGARSKREEIERVELQAYVVGRLARKEGLAAVLCYASSEAKGTKTGEGLVPDWAGTAAGGELLGWGVMQQGT